MRFLLLTTFYSILILMTFFCSTQDKQTEQGITGLRNYLLAVEQKLMDAVALGDTSSWLTYLHPDCLITLEDGKSMTRNELIASIKPLPAGYVGRIEVIEPNFQQHGNTAVLNFVLDEYLELYNQKIHTQYRQQSTWRKFAGEWKLIACQVFEIPKNPTPSSLPLATLRRYEGIYTLSKDRNCTVFIQDGKLMARKTNREAQELLAETENVFFRADDGRVRVLFVKNPATNAYQMIERRAGEDLIWSQ